MLYRSCLLLLAASFTGAAAARSGVDAPPASADLASAAPIALLIDVSSGQTLFARDPDRRFLPASMTKVMTALVAFDLIKAGRLREDDLITVRPETARKLSGKGTSLWLRPGESVRVSDLLDGIVTASANDASVALAEGVMGSEALWIQAMNARARSLGMLTSQFASANGLPDGGRTQVTARDMARLAEGLIVEHPQLYRRYFGHKDMVWRGRRLVSHNPLAGLVEGADGIKTGHTREAGFTFLGAVERAGRRLVLVVGQAPNESARANAAREMVEWGYSAWRSRPFLAPGTILGAVKVQDGAARTVAVTVPRGYTLAVPVGANPQVVGTIVYRGPVRAPIAKGAALGDIEIRIAGAAPYRLPVVAAHAVPQAGPIDRVVNGLLGLIQ